MKVRFKIHNLAQFELRPITDVKVGDIFIQHGRPWMRSTINRNELQVDLCGNPSPVAHDLGHASHGMVARLCVGLELRIVPLGELVRKSQDVPIAGNIALMKTGAALFGNFADDQMDQEPGRLAVGLASGESIFHDREFPFSFETWEVSWVDKRGHPALSMRREA